MNNLTLDEIQKIHDEILEQCSKAIPTKSWKHQVNSAVRVGTYQSDFAKAHVDGNDDIYVSVHPLFLQTRFVNKLKAVMAHEFTHFVLGLDENHNRKFKRFESFLLDNIDYDLDAAKSEADEFVSKIDFKWTVIAHLVDGTELYIGGVHRKTKTYSEYPRTEREKHTVSVGEHRGKTVARYEFIQNR